MKIKNTFFVMVLMSLIFGTPLVSTAQNQNSTCPQNLICTPIPKQPVGCPVGYTCTVKEGKGVVVTDTKAQGSLVDNGTNASNSAIFNFSFKINNLDNNDIYISRTYSNSIGTKVIGSAQVVKGGFVAESPAVVTGDTPSAYVIPSGVSRTFTVNGLLSLTSSPSGMQNISLNKINYSRNASGNDLSINTGLDKLNYSIYLSNASSTTSGTAKITTRLNPMSPISSNIQGVVNSKVKLAVFDIKSLGVNSNLKNIKLDIVVSGGKIASDVFSEISVSGNSINNPQLHSSIPLAISLPADQFVPLVVEGKLKSGIPSGTKVYIRLISNNENINAYDASQKAVSIEASSISGNVMTIISLDAPTVSEKSAEISTVDNGTSLPNQAVFNFGFRINNVSDKDIYASKDTKKFVSVAIEPAANFTLSSSTTIVSPSSLAGDTTSYYIIPANSSRYFKVFGNIDDRNGQRQNRRVYVYSINLASSTNSEPTIFIRSGLESLSTPSIFVQNSEQETLATNDISIGSVFTTAIFNSFKLLFGISR